MNPETNKFEHIPEGQGGGPSGWIEFEIGEEVGVKGYNFKIKRVSAHRLVLEPVLAICTTSNAKEK